MRRLLSFICCLTLCVLCVCPTVTAKIMTYQYYGDFTYSSYYNKAGEIVDYCGSKTELVIPATLEGHRVRHVRINTSDGVSPKKIVIEKGITSIHRLSWAENRVTEVELPKGLVNIAPNAMRNLTGLTTLTIPSSVMVIGANAFPDGITLRAEEGSYAARWAEANGYTLETFTIPRSVGDVNGDELVNSTDARLILQYFVNGIDEEGLDADFADIDKNGEVDSTDARLALQYFVGAEAPETITAPTVKVFEGWLDPAKVKSVYARIYRPEPYPHRVAKSGEVVDPKATVEAINEYISNSYGWEAGSIKHYQKWELEITLNDGSVRYINSNSFSCEGSSYKWWPETNPPPFEMTNQ